MTDPKWTQRFNATAGLSRDIDRLFSGDAIKVSDAMFSEIFHQEIDPVRELFLALSGNRPTETTAEIVAFFCTVNNCDHRMDVITGEHYFTKRKWRDMGDVQRYIRAS